MKTYVRDVAGSLPEYGNNASITINQVTQIVWCPSAYISYSYTTLWPIEYIDSIMPEKQCIYLKLKNTVLLKIANHYLTTQKC